MCCAVCGLDADSYLCYKDVCRLDIKGSTIDPEARLSSDDHHSDQRCSWTERWENRHMSSNSSEHCALCSKRIKQKEIKMNRNGPKSRDNPHDEEQTESSALYLKPNKSNL